MHVARPEDSADQLTLRVTYRLHPHGHPAEAPRGRGHATDPIDTTPGLPEVVVGDACLAEIVGVPEVDERSTHDLGRCPAQQLLAGGRHPSDDAALGLQHDVGRVLGEESQLRLRLGKCFRTPLAFGHITDQERHPGADAIGPKVDHPQLASMRRVGERNAIGDERLAALDDVSEHLDQAFITGGGLDVGQPTASQLGARDPDSTRCTVVHVDVDEIDDRTCRVTQRLELHHEVGHRVHGRAQPQSLDLVLCLAGVDRGHVANGPVDHYRAVFAARLPGALLRVDHSTISSDPATLEGDDLPEFCAARDAVSIGVVRVQDALAEVRVGVVLGSRIPDEPVHRRRDVFKGNRRCKADDVDQVEEVSCDLQRFGCHRRIERRQLGGKRVDSRRRPAGAAPRRARHRHCPPPLAHGQVYT